MTATAIPKKTKDEQQAEQERLQKEAEDRLRKLEDEIKSEHSAVKALMMDGRQKAVYLGTLLIEAREKVNVVSKKKGRWREWVRGHCQFTLRTAQYYMRIAKNEGKFAQDKKINLARAIYLLTVEDKTPRADGKTQPHKRTRSAIEERMKKYHIKAKWQEMVDFLKSMGVNLAAEATAK